MLKLPSGNAICYSGYRRGQSPDARRYPSIEEIREDLHLLSRHWRLLRLYDCSAHAERVLDVIRRDRLDLGVMLGAWVAAEVNNPGCPWGGLHSDAQLAANVAANDAEVERLVDLARHHDDLVFAVAVGNEAAVDWTDHLVSVERLVELARRVKQSVPQPVTYCENYVPWRDRLRPLARELDFLCLHTYPAWEQVPVHEAIAHSRDNYRSVASLYPDKPVVISEAGWTTRSNGRGIPEVQAGEDPQAEYLAGLMDWTRREGILTFVFEAFDEPWKGSPDPAEPEKHWGLFTVDREPKRAIRTLYPERPPPAAGASVIDALQHRIACGHD